VYFYQCLFIINYFEVSMSHWDNNDRVETMKRGNREYAESRKLERRREEFLEGNWLGEFLLLQIHDGEQPIGTYPVPADKPRRSSPTHPTRRIVFPSSWLVAAMSEDRREACAASSQHNYRDLTIHCRFFFLSGVDTEVGTLFEPLVGLGQTGSLVGGVEAWRRGGKWS
jgi:hypothetical protein